MHSIRTKITLLTVSVVIIALSVAALIGVASIKKLGRNDADQMLYLMANTGAMNLESYFVSVEHSVETVSALVQSSLEGMSLEDLDVQIERARNLFGSIAHNTNGVLTYYLRIDPEVSEAVKGFWYVYQEGEGFQEHEVTDITQFDTNDTSALVWFTVPKATGEGVWLPPYYTENLDIRVVSYNVPIYWEGRFLGVIGIEIDYGSLARIVETIKIFETGCAFILDEELNVFCHPQMDSVKLDREAITFREVERSIGSSCVQYRYRGVEKEAVWVPLSNGMRLYVAAPVSELDSGWTNMVWNILVASLVILAAASVVMLRFSGRFTKPLRELTEAAKRADQGDYEFALEYRGDDEAGVLTETFLSMRERLKVQLAELSRSKNALQEALRVSEQASRAKTAFLSNMSHEIRTPMNAIIGLDNIALKDPDLTPRTREQLEKIETSAKHLLSIINDILDMSRIESGRMELKEEAFSFREFLKQINVMVGGQCADKGLQYECRVIGKPEDYYVGDEIKLKQVLINILGNAVKFTPAPGSVTFTVEQTAGFENHRSLRFIIRDTGIGMSADYLPKIFEAFSQETEGSSNKLGSTGLGMAITKNIVSMMNGNIAVESKKGVGSTFTVTVTLKSSDRREPEAQSPALPAEPGAAADGEPEHSAGEGLAGRLVLVAEDMELNAEILMDLLELEGVHAQYAENGQLAVDMFSAHPAGYYDAILMDIRMPVMDGLAATRAIRALDRPDAKRIPIIAMTANAFEEDVQQSLQAGMNAHLSKPVEPEHLYEVLRKLIARDSGARHIQEQE